MGTESVLCPVCQGVLPGSGRDAYTPLRGKLIVTNGYCSGSCAARERTQQVARPAVRQAQAPVARPAAPPQQAPQAQGQPVVRVSS